MLNIEITGSGGEPQVLQVSDEAIIGRDAESEVRLDSWRVGKEHARLLKTPRGVLLEELNAFGGVFVNGVRIEGQHGPLRAEDAIAIGPFTIRLLEEGGGAAPAPGEPLPPMTAPEPAHAMPAPPPVVARAEPEPAPPRMPPEPPPSPVARAARPVTTPKAKPAPSSADEAPAPRALEYEWRKRIHTRLLETMDLRRHDVSSMSDSQLRAETEALIRQILQEQAAQLPRELDRELLCRHVLDEAVGLGPLEELLADDSVSEIMVNRFDEIFVEQAGRLRKHELTFTGDRAVMGVIERIVAPLGRRIDESSPMVDARLKDGSRVNAIIPPLALKGPTLTIRKFAKRKLGIQDLVGFGAVSPDMGAFLEVCVKARKNIVVSGGTGSGKTTLLNILSNFIPNGERIITVEDAAELQLHHEHLISLESRPANVEGRGAVPIRDLVKNTLRMRPDRIVVGECRGAEALDMLQAMNTGHEGSLTTLHANTPRDGLARLETMVLMAGMDLPLSAIREQIASAVDIVVQQTRFACGSRKVTSITELTGIESGKIQIQELFKYAAKGYGAPDEQGARRVQGYFSACNTVPSFYEELRASGTELDLAIFSPDEQERATAGGFDN
jgi:pilus assembly protein CpaF